ncbi:MAG: gluconate 2-dehydrogenase subunit 3 family protein [Bacteroidota bacterium]
MNRREALKRTAVLGGTAAVSTSLLGLLQGCQQQPRLGWSPTFLSTDHAQLVSALVDTVLPKTDTPGGLDVKADMFIDLVFDKTLDDAGKDQKIAEMDAFNADCNARYGSAFHELDLAQKTEYLQEQEANAPKFNGGVWGTAVGEQPPVGFYRSLKSLMVWAYFSSEEVGKDVTNYDPIPGPYQGCIPLADVGKVYSY